MKLNKLSLLILTLITHTTYAFEKTSYTFSRDPIDVVILCHKKDANTLPNGISSVQRCVIGLRRIIIISAEKYTDDAEWCDESIFPFTKESILLEICQSQNIAQQALKQTRTTGWIYQQFLKLYAPLCIPNISANVLIVDADVLFLQPVAFLQENGAGLYAVGSEYHKPYFEHMQRLLPDLKKLYNNYSGITHHMLFQREILIDFFDHIRAQHNLEPWVAIARTIKLNRENHLIHSCLSEYEMYFNFVFARTDQVSIRHLKWKNIMRLRQLKRCIAEHYDFVAQHIYKE